ncbi:hypothetical protein NBRC110019_07580 [Neptunitalea chrysea]|uniref:Phage virion morphogenesis protein n=1 Tax=Neptunitalea chrysea TaxID=1647581 RepID=A0A9W6B5L6_9FLAO|nr:phage virion morphogenesis protein [Neptunitalea chrysea]GLB51719.1 hypothetical protein NBRC110019_07580 [Neptunitalea chrysea]
MSKLQIPDFLGIATQLKKDTRLYARRYCLQWFDDSFKNQGFTDAAFEAWPKRDPDKDPGRAILTDTTFLRRSLAVLNEDATSMQFGTHVPYAAVHNDGLRVRTVQNVRGFHRNRKGKREQVKPHTRRRDTKYKQRKFIGESKQMMDNLDQWLLNEIEKRFKQ